LYYLIGYVNGPLVYQVKEDAFRGILEVGSGTDTAGPTLAAKHVFRSGKEKIKFL
jgi:hypothetical protein